MIRFEASVSNPFIKTGTFTMIKDFKKKLFNRFDLAFQCYKYDYILAALEFRASRHSATAHVCVLGHSVLFSVSGKS